MYEHISKEILQMLGICRTATQCESCFKTIAKRKKTEDTNNKTSGHTRCQVSYEEEFAQIRAADDSIEPEVLRGVHSVTYKSVPKPFDEASTSTSATGSSESTDHNSSELPDDSACETAEEAGHERRKRMKNNESGRPSGGGQMMHMQYFFERMEKINKERELKKDEREKRREERHLELIKLHKEHIDALKDLATKAGT